MKCSCFFISLFFSFLASLVGLSLRAETSTNRLLWQPANENQVPASFNAQTSGFYRKILDQAPTACSNSPRTVEFANQSHDYYKTDPRKLGALVNEDESIRKFKPSLKEANGTTNEIAEWRNQLSKKGIDLGFSSINEVWGNTTGGAYTGSVYTSLLQFATTLNLEKLIDWNGCSFYSRWIYLAGEDPGTNLAGSIFGISSIAGYSTLRNLELWLQQNMLDDIISLRAGQLVADSEFAISDYGALFINDTFGWPAGLYTSIPNGGPAYPVGAPGIRLKVTPNDLFSFQTAAFQGNVYSENVNNHGFHWNLNSNQGYFYITEAAYHYQCVLPGKLKTGCWFSSSTFQNFSNQNNTLSGNYGIYAISDQMIYRCPDKNEAKNISLIQDKQFLVQSPHRGLGFFNRITFEPACSNLLNLYDDSGFVFRGLFPSRAQDILGVACAYGLLSNGAINTMKQNQKTGASLSNTTFDIELTYQLQITSCFTLQPDLQYIIHPGMSEPLPNALIIGLRGNVTF